MLLALWLPLGNVSVEIVGDGVRSKVEWNVSPSTTRASMATGRCLGSGRTSRRSDTLQDHLNFLRLGEIVKTYAGFHGAYFQYRFTCRVT